MQEDAVLLTALEPTAEDAKVANVLELFGVPCRRSTPALFPPPEAVRGQTAGIRLLCPADAFLLLLDNVERRGLGEAWTSGVHSVFVYAGSAGSDPGAPARVAAALVPEGGATLRPLDAAGHIAVASDLDDFCGVMSGVRVAATAANISASAALHVPGGAARPVISTDRGAVFLRAGYRGVPVFLSTCHALVDVDAEVPGRQFDVRDQFLAAVPLVLYVTWACPATAWTAPETRACVVIDDPLLTPRYGFMSYRGLLARMERHGFSASIAFIPWNWQRSDPDVAGLFTANPGTLSLSVHGCDHTDAEFGTGDRGTLGRKVSLALDRMSRHEANTGIHHDRVMVFPQGVFSRAAITALKHSPFIGAVNTEVVSVDRPPPGVRIADVWDVAVMAYDSFPVFTRRYPAQGVENFAFDILLGKPCLVVIHHDYCRDDYMHLVTFVDRLNALNCSLVWGSLGDVLRRSCRRRTLSPGVDEVRMYGSELRIENRSARPLTVAVGRREPDPASVRAVRAGARRIEPRFGSGQMAFDVDLGALEAATVGIEFHARPGTDRTPPDRVSDRTRTMVRRYLSEVRDNYISTGKARVRGLIRRGAH